MSAADSIIDVMREVVLAPNPALVTREELIRLEERVDSVLALMDMLEERIDELDSVGVAQPAKPAHFYTPPPPRP